MAENRDGPGRFPVDEAAPTEALAPSEERRSGVRTPDPEEGDTLLAEPEIGQAPPQAEGKRFGRYDMHRALAVGGMAEVFLAREVGSHGARRHVAVKRILPQFAQDPTFVQMFLDEARLAMQLNHPSICHIYDFGDVDGTYFIAMEFVNGVPLGEIIQRCPAGVPLGFATKIIAQVAEALHHAHQARDDVGRPLNIVHRDVSPLNVMVRFDGVVKLLDFGIAKAATQSQQTQAGVVKGKFSYMSPEQCLGKPLDGRSDIFALGACLHEALTARPLFKRRNELETMRAVVHDAVPSVCAARSDVPPAIDAVLQKAMAKDAADRFQTAGEMFMALEQLLASEGELVRAMHIAGFLERLVPERVAAGNRLGSAQAATGQSTDAMDSARPEGGPPSGQVVKVPPPPPPRPAAASDFRDIPTREMPGHAASSLIDDEDEDEDDYGDIDLPTSRISPKDLIAMLRGQRTGEPPTKPRRDRIRAPAAVAPETDPSRPTAPSGRPRQPAAGRPPPDPHAHSAPSTPAAAPPRPVAPEAVAPQAPGTFPPGPSRPSAQPFAQPPLAGVGALKDAPLRSATKRRRMVLGVLLAVLLATAGAGGMYWYRTDQNRRAAAAAALQAQQAALRATPPEPPQAEPVRPEAPPAPADSVPAQVAPTEAAETQATNSSTGTLVVEVQPEGAFVHIGRRRRRRAPATFSMLRPGNYFIRASARGYRRSSARGGVVAGETAMVTIELRRARRRRR